MILLANVLTLVRIPLGLLFWVLADDPPWAMTVLAAGGLTDVIDGPIARHARRTQSRKSGHSHSGRTVFSWLDPLCDKFFVLSVLLATYVARDVPVGVIFAIAAREILLVPLALVYRFTTLLRARMRYDFTAGPIGKAATVAQFVALVAVLIDHSARDGAAAVAAAVGLAAAVHYIGRGVRLARAQPAGAPFRGEPDMSRP